MNFFYYTVLVGLLGSLALAGQAVAAAEPPPSPMKWGVERLDAGELRSEGGTFRLALHFVKRTDIPQPEGKLTLTPDLVDGWGRVFWAGKPVDLVAGDAKTPGRMEFAVPYPPLPAGRYLFRGVITDAAGVKRATVEAAMSRFERFDPPRDLLWLYWGGGAISDEMAKALLDVGINGGGGTATDYRFPYGFWRDHAAQLPTERYPEDVVLHPEGTGLDWFRSWTSWMAYDGGLALVLMTDEIEAVFSDPAMRAVLLRLARRNAWMNIPTLNRFNAYFRTDFLNWDEVFREGFPPLDHPQFKGAPIGWTAGREFRDVEMPMMRVALIRQANPYLLSSPGATHCLTDSWADSFNSRNYNRNTTLDCINLFISVQPNYGLRPGNKLTNLKPGYLTGLGTYWPVHEHQYWSALANNDRMFILYGPGDYVGDVPVDNDAKITDSGRGFQAIRNIIHPLRPAILSTRSQVDPAVVSLYHGHEDGGGNLMDGLIANGIMPLGAHAPGQEAKLIFAINAHFSAPVLDAVRGGAGLVCGGKSIAGDLAALGIEVGEAAPEAGKTAEELQKKLESDPEQDPQRAGAVRKAASPEIDLTPLAKAFPGLAGVKVAATYVGDAKVKPGSGFEEIRAGGKLVAVTGPLGKGWLVYLNFNLLNMARADGWGASHMAMMGDDSIPARNAALVRALLTRAGVPERIRVTDRAGNIAPLVRAFAAETRDQAQKYLFIVSEAMGIPGKDPADGKTDTLRLACENPLTGAIRIMDPSVKAVRDLRTGKLLPLKAEAQGVSVDYSLVPGQGTMLSLLTAIPTGRLSMQLSQAEVAGAETVNVEVCRRDEQGAPLALPGHALWVRFLDPQGREVEALTRWATGGGPHVFPATFALSDPEGEWTVAAEDQTDGTRAETKLRRQAKAAGPRTVHVPSAPSPRSPYAVTLESTPYLDGDLILTEIRGTLKCSAAGATPVTLRLPANPAGAAREVTGTSPKAYAEVPFAIPLWMSRAQAQAVCGQRYEGVEVAVTAPGLPADRFRYVPNILPLEREPQRIGDISGSKVTVKVNNFTRTGQRVAIALASLPGEEGKPWQASESVPPGASAVFGRTVAGLPALTDPGLYSVALDWRVGDVAQPSASLPVEALGNSRQEWWVKAVNPLDQVKLDPDNGAADEDILLEKPKGEPAPALPATAAGREKAGWRRVQVQGVVWWSDITPPKFTFGRVYVATEVKASRETQVRVSAIGPTPPGIAWVNGELVAVGPNAAPVVLRQGRNEVIQALELTAKKNPLVYEVKKGVTPVPPGYALALLDPVTGKRDRTLSIGDRLDADDKTGKPSASPVPETSVTIERPAAKPALTDPGVTIEWVNPQLSEGNPMALDASVEQEWWIQTVTPLAEVKMGDGLSAGKDEFMLDPPKGEVAPVLPLDPAARDKAGWRRVAVRGELVWPVVAPNFGFGQIHAVTHVVAPEACKVRIAFGGRFPPGSVWVNGVRVEGGAAPVALRQGANTVALTMGVNKRFPKPTRELMPSCWLVLLDPESGRRNRALRIGAGD